MHRGALVSRRRGVIGRYAEIGPGFQPQVVGQARVDTGRIEVLRGVRAYGEQGVIYVGRGRTARDIRPIVVLHHDEENRLEWLPGGRHGEAGGGAGHAARGVADDDRELVSVVGSGSGGCGVAGGGGCADRRAVLLPLIAQGCRARGRDREGRPLTGGHRLTRRLCRDRGSDQHGIHRESGGPAGHAARGVADDDRELVAVVGGGGGGCGVAGGGGCADRRAVLLPLIAQGCRARGGDREGRRLTGGHRLTRGLCRDRGSHRRGIHRESGGVAGHAAHGVADDDRELVAVVGSGGGGCGVAGGGGCADHRAVLLPLIAQGCRARGGDREGRRLTGGHRLTRRLCRDRGSHRRGIHRESGGVAGHAAHGVADDDRELVAVVGSGGGGCGVAGGGGCADHRAVLLPLIAQGCRARGGDREGRRLTGGHHLTCRLCRDRGSDRRGIHRESGGVAGHAARGVADDNGELGAAVGSGSGGCGVAGGGGCADRRAVLLPLIAQGCRARGRDREGRRLTGGHHLTRRLCRDRGSDRRGIHRESGGVAGHAARGVADDNGELGAVVGSGGGGCGVAGGGGSADRRAVLLPLIAQGCRARGRDREGRPLTGAHRLTRRLRRDRGSDQHGTHRESGGVAGHAAYGVADDDRELVAVVGSGGGGWGVDGGGGCADRRAVLLPLVAQGRSE